MKIDKVRGRSKDIMEENKWEGGMRDGVENSGKKVGRGSKRSGGGRGAEKAHN